MEKLNLNATGREEIGKEAAKKLRGDGFIPAVLHKGKNPHHLKMLSGEFWKIIHTKAGENVVVNLQIEGDLKHKTKPTTKVSRTAMIKEIQYHPVKGDILHVDFNEISLTEVLAVKVPIAVKGEAQGIKEGGVLEHVLWEIEVECLPTQIPENIPVDVAALKIGDSILVENLQIPSEVKILSDAKATVITLAAPHVEKEEEKLEEEMLEPEVIMERRPKEEELPAEGSQDKKEES